MPAIPKAQRRSGCPLSISLEIVGDRWTLLIVRDLMVRGLRGFGEFLESGERIATNILSDRLRKLLAAGIVEARSDENDARRMNYRLTEKGIDLAPVLLELLFWAARHEKTAAPPAQIAAIRKNRKRLLSEVRRQWRNGQVRPLLPPFQADTGLQ